MIRGDGRRPDELRRVSFTRNYIKFAEGSVLMEAGDTRVICTATLEERVPPFLQNKGTGWLTSEYSMLPRSSMQRIPRESVQGRVQGRTHEIQRLIGRSLRSVVDLRRLGPRTITVDCDVIQADGGTRTASITGAFVAVSDLLASMRQSGILSGDVILDTIAAVSVGIVDGEALLDLTYEEDSRAWVDMNVVMTGSGRFIEVQGTAESSPFSRAELDGLVGLATKGIGELTTFQKNAVEKT